MHYRVNERNITLKYHFVIHFQSALSYMQKTNGYSSELIKQQSLATSDIILMFVIIQVCLAAIINSNTLFIQY